MDKQDALAALSSSAFDCTSPSTKSIGNTLSSRLHTHLIRLNATNIYTKTLQWLLCTKTHAMRRSTDRSTKQGQKRYKTPFDRLVQCELRICMSHFVYVDWLPLTMTAADSLATETYSKMLPRTIRPFQIIDVGQHMLTIDKDEISNKIFIKCTASVSNPANLHLRVSKSQQRKKCPQGRKYPECPIGNCNPTWKYSNMQTS